MQRKNRIGRWLAGCLSAALLLSPAAGVSADGPAVTLTAGTTQIEAEAYTAMSGVQTEACGEGTLNVSFIDSGDWMEYALTVPTAGSYRLFLRAASPNGGGLVYAQIGGSRLSEANIYQTGGWQIYETIDAGAVSLPSGAQTLRLYVQSGGFNLNWLTLVKADAEVSYDFSTNTGSGMTVGYGNDCGLVTLAGHGQVARDLDFLNFTIDRSVLGSTVPALTVEVTYLDTYAAYDNGALISENSQKFLMQYDGMGGDYTSAGSIRLTDSGQFVTSRFYMLDAQLNGGQGGNDLRIGCVAIGWLESEGRWGNFPLYIQKVRVYVSDAVGNIQPPAFPAATNLNSFSGKSVAGYQMWFEASSDESGWIHWSKSGSRPSTGDVSFEQWPYVADYAPEVLENTGFGNLGSGAPAQLFTTVKADAVDTQVSWMRDAGLDGFAIQRFYGTTGVGRQNGRTNLDLAKDAAEKYGRVFYVMYDLNGAYGDGMKAVDRLKADWIYNVEGRGLISSPCYAQMGGKPVVCLWGLNQDSTSYMTHDATKAFITWLQARGYYVIGGIANGDWTNPSDPYADVYQMLDMASQWTVGVYGDNNVLDWMTNHVPNHLAYCAQYGIDYQPVVFAGSCWSNANYGPQNDNPRLAGAYLWKQAHKLKTLGAGCVYFAMYDEYDEGTALMKSARDSFDIPSDEQYFLTNAADGIWLSEDFYLRAAGAVCKLMRGDIPNADTLPIAHANGPLYWRNSFEYRTAPVKNADRDILYYATVPVDVCSPESPVTQTVAGTVNVTKAHAEKIAAVTGQYAYRYIGSITAAPAKAYTTIGTADILVEDGMTLTYSLKPVNAGGRRVYVDLLFSDGQLLSQKMSGVDGQRGTTGQWAAHTVALDSSLTGLKITAIVAAVDASASGSFEAALDDILLEAPEKATADIYAGTTRVESENYTAMYGIQTEVCGEGTRDVGYTDGGDWLDYRLDVQKAGSYLLRLRAASPSGGGLLSIRSGDSMLASIDIPNTEGWQTYQTLNSTVFQLPAGQQTLRLHIVNGNFNMNWFELVYQGSEGASATYRATAVGGGATFDGNGCVQNLHLSGAYCEFSGITGSGPQTVTLTYAIDGTATVGVVLNGEAVTTLHLTTTGSWDAYTGTISFPVTLNGAVNTLRLTGGSGGFNVDSITVSAAA